MVAQPRQRSHEARRQAGANGRPSAGEPMRHHDADQDIGAEQRDLIGLDHHEAGRDAGENRLSAARSAAASASSATARWRRRRGSRSARHAAPARRPTRRRRRPAPPAGRRPDASRDRGTSAEAPARRRADAPAHSHRPSGSWDRASAAPAGSRAKRSAIAGRRSGASRRRHYASRTATGRCAAPGPGTGSGPGNAPWHRRGSSTRPTARASTTRPRHRRRRERPASSWPSGFEGSARGPPGPITRPMPGLA